MRNDIEDSEATIYTYCIYGCIYIWICAYYEVYNNIFAEKLTLTHKKVPKFDASHYNDIMYEHAMKTS